MGPVCTKYLADFGAEVIKIESTAAPDAARGNLPYRDSIAGVNRSCHYAWLNTSKKSITLNLKEPKGKEIAKKLVAVSDVVIENFTPGTMDKLGLSYDDLKKYNPQIIMASLSSSGQTGPYRLMPAFGNFISAWAGLDSHLVIPGREPVISYVPHPDYLGAHAGLIAIIGSLLYRKRTGKGQYIDISMLEVTISLIAPSILDYFVNGREHISRGNRSNIEAPHGIYRCAGQDRWCAISIRNDTEWADFIKAIGNPTWASDTKYSTFIGRKENEDELDKHIEEWTMNNTAEKVMYLLQSYDIAAGIIQNGRDLIEDPQLKYRKHFKIVEGHSEIGAYYSSVASFIMSEAEPCLGPAPCLGQDNIYVFSKILGISDEEIASLINSGIIQ